MFCKGEKHEATFLEMQKTAFDLFGVWMRVRVKKKTIQQSQLPFSLRRRG
jgi:hypothetical protein